MPRITRRKFLTGCSAAIAALAGARITRLAFADDKTGAARAQAAGERTLIVLFLRGGWDALNVVPPIGDDRKHYVRARPSLALPERGENAALPLDDRFGLHPALAPLHELYQDGAFAVVHATGLAHETRSHFDAMEYMELGTPGQKTTREGWIARHLLATGVQDGALLAPALAIGNAPTSLREAPQAVAVQNLDDFKLWGDESFFVEQRRVLNRLYTGETWAHAAGAQTLRALDGMSRLLDGAYETAAGVEYPGGELSDQLSTLARLIKSDAGLQVATLDYGGWDTHDYQGDEGTGQFGAQLDQLGRSLLAFHQDLGARAADVTVLVMSEFGRRLEQNSSQGTDHGHGSALFLMGGGVNGGKVYGDWPGLAHEQLFDQVDLAITTDYRQVVSEVLGTRFGNPDPGYVFPGFTPGASLGIVRA